MSHPKTDTRKVTLDLRNNKQWIQDKLDNNAISKAEDFGAYLANGNKHSPELTTSKLRKFFSALKRIEAEGYNDQTSSEFILLKPYLAYTAGREKKEHKIHDFYEELKHGIDMVSHEKEFKNFVKLVEAIVAYHKAAGGKD